MKVDTMPLDNIRRTFEIEDDIPIPEGPSHETRTVYPLSQLEPGKSFFVPASDDVPLKVLQNRIKAAIGGAQRRTPGSSFTWRQMEDALPEEKRRAAEENREPQKTVGIRVWRQV